MPPWTEDSDLGDLAEEKAGLSESGEGDPLVGRPAEWLWAQTEPGWLARVPLLSASVIGRDSDGLLEVVGCPPAST